MIDERQRPAIRLLRGERVRLNRDAALLQVGEQLRKLALCFGRSGYAFVCLLGKQAIDQLRNFDRHIAIDLDQRTMRELANAMQHSHSARSPERWMTGKHKVEHTAQTEHIAAMIH